VPALIIELRVERPDKIREAPVGNLAAPGLERLANSLSAMEAIYMKRAIALVLANLPAARPEELAGPEVAAECVNFGVLFHDVNLTSRQPESMC
jgi:hypothetical protein